MDSASRTKSEGVRAPHGLVDEGEWLLRAAAWSVIGATIVSYAFLFRLGPRFLAGSDAPLRSYSWAEYVFAPFATLLHPLGLEIVLGWAIVAMVPARFLVRHRDLTRSTLFSAACVAAYVVLCPRMVLFRLTALPLEPLVVLSMALLVCRLWPGRFFAPRPRR